MLIPAAFLTRLDALPAGYGEGLFAGRRYGVTVARSADHRRQWLWAEELGGSDRVSFNLYRLGGDRSALRPCEMSGAKVIDFVLGYVPLAHAGVSVDRSRAPRRFRG
ncbi:hypothetical protein K7957_14695 [Sphingomonas yunnanensis]|uniref:hypothetical protein n=1 Tax=Sphingomonas yunnanensis TaxID=310400 RepID=UPI001CA7499D|nr:hypothetical protein [Sphingomonas yunnanensis]MBY9064188.1 hypothetical protein [Sphingomonas yunnanensis]